MKKLEEILKDKRFQLKSRAFDGVDGFAYSSYISGRKTAALKLRRGQGRESRPSLIHKRKCES